jgi:hypothetical protein
MYWAHWQGHPWISKLSTIWDANWYANVATRGYDRSLPVVGSVHGHTMYSNLAFFPLYPGLIRVARAVTPLNTHHAALMIAWAASLVAAWGIFAVGSRCYGRRVGILAAVLWGVLPQAVVESLAYTESLFTALAAWSLCAVLTRRWVWAGVLCALAGLTRPSGAALVAAVGVAAGAELLRLRREVRPRSMAWRPGLGALIAPVGVVGYVGWVGLRLGRWDGYLVVQGLWHTTFDWGHATARQMNSILLLGDPAPAAKVAVALVLCAAAVLFAASLVNRQPLPLLVYSAAIMVIALGDSGFFNSRARFLIPAFPLLLPLAAGLARVRARSSQVALLGSAAGCSALFGGYLVYLYHHAL